MLKIYTARINYKGAKNELVLNTTVGSGHGIGKTFAPTWKMVRGSKSGAITWEDYTKQYIALMNQRFVEHESAFRQVCESGDVVLKCYCGNTSTTTQHCHRYLLTDILIERAAAFGIEAEYMGEVP